MSNAADAQLDNPPSVYGAGTPHLSTETKFMQQYRIAAAVHGGGDMVSIRNNAGDVEAFTVGTDGSVWNFYPDVASDTGYSSVSTGLVARWVVAGTDAAGRIILFAANNLVLNYVRETGQVGAARWGRVLTATVPLPISPIAIAGLYTGTIGGALYVGVLTRFQSASPSNSYAFSYCVWNDSPGVFMSSSMNLSTLNCVWSGSSASTAQFTVLDTVYLGYNIATRSVQRYPFAATFRSLSVATSIDSAANNRYFSVLSDGNLYQMIGGSGGAPYSWAQITQGMNFREVSSAVSGANDIQLFTLGTDANLFHFQPSAGTGTGYTHAMVVQSDVALMGVTDQNAGNIEVFTVGTTQATLSHLIRQRESGNWQIAPLEVPTSGQVEEFISFSTDLMVYDAAGSPMPNAAIQVWASSQTEIMVNGGAYVVDAQTPANLRCASSGGLSITQATGILGIPTLQINVVNSMPSGQAIAVAQFAGVQERLANVTGADLMTATTVGGQPLLGDAYRTPEQTNSLASAFNKCMALTTAQAVPHATEMFKNRTGIKRGVGVVPSNRTGDLNRISAPASPMHWQLDFSTGKVVYRDLSAEDATHLLLEKRATHLASSQSVGGFLDWIGSIGDFIEGIAQGIISIVDTVITTVGNAVNAVFTFIVDGITYLYETVVQFIDQAFDLVEAFFAQVKVIFQKIFEWLGFIFSWPDILRTHDALAYTMNQFLGFLPLATAGLQQLFDQAITSVQSQMNVIFDQLVADVGGTSSLGGYANTQTPDAPLYSSSNANNIVLNGTLENAKTATQTTTVATPNSSPFDILITQMQQLATSVENDPAFADALNYMTNLGGSADQIFSQLLAALIRVVQGLANAMIAGVKAIVDGFLQLVQSFLATLQSLFNAEWNIPFVSQFYSWLTNGSKLTLSDLLALILAIPATIVYKVIYNAAPFPDQASVDAFKASFNSQTMLANSGLGGNTAKRKAQSTQLATSPSQLASGGISSWQVLLGVSGAISTFAYASLSAVMDIKPTLGTGVVDPVIKTLTKIALGCEIYSQAAAFPWFYSTGAPDCTTASGVGRWMWMYTSLGVVLDAGFTIYNEAFAENNDTIWGIVVAALYGGGHTIVTAATGSRMSGASLAANIILLVPEVGKLLKLPAVETATKGFSLPAIAAIDFLFITSAGIVGFVDLLTSSDQAHLALVHVPGSVSAAAL